MLGEPANVATVLCAHLSLGPVLEAASGNVRHPPVRALHQTATEQQRSMYQSVTSTGKEM